MIELFVYEEIIINAHHKHNSMFNCRTLIIRVRLNIAITTFLWTVATLLCMDVTVLLLYGHYCMTLLVDNMLCMCLLVFGGRLVVVCVVVPCSIIVCAVYILLALPLF